MERNLGCRMIQIMMLKKTHERKILLLARIHRRIWNIYFYHMMAFVQLALIERLIGKSSTIRPWGRRKRSLTRRGAGVGIGAAGLLLLPLGNAASLDIQRLPLQLELFLSLETWEIQLVSYRFSTGAGVTGGSALIHDFYAREVPNPVHLTVDTAFTDEKQTIKAFVSNSLSIGDHQLAAQFQEIPLDTRMVEAERVGFDILKTTMVDRLPGDMEGMEATMERLLSLIDDVSKYVDDVVEGRVAPDNNIGRFISDTVASLPKFSPQVFNKLVNDSFQDHSLVLYLSSIARTQLSLAHSLNSAAQTM